MDQPSNKVGDLHVKLLGMDQAEAHSFMSSLPDATLWELFKLGNKEAFSILFKKCYKPAMVLVYKRLNHTNEIRWEQVEDATGDFIQKALEGQYQEVDLKKNFTAFMTHYVGCLAKDKLKLAVNRRVERLQVSAIEGRATSPILRVEEKIDFRIVIDFIPKISNNAYRMVLYLVFILGYNSSDLTEVFGQRERAYDKRSRAMKAFRVLLEKEGILEELRQP